MQKHRKILGIIALLLTLLPWSINRMLAADTPQQTNTLTLETVTAEANSSGKLQILLENQDAIASGQIEFSYDTANGVAFTGVTKTDRTTPYTALFNESSGSGTVVNVKILFYDATSTSTTIGAGSGAIFELALTTAASASGTTPVNISKLLLSDTSFSSVSVIGIDGSVTIGSEPTPTPTMTSTSMATATPASSTPESSSGPDLNVSMPNELIGFQSRTITIPVSLAEDVTGQGIFSVESSLNYDGDVLEFSGLEKDDLLMSDWTLATHEPGTGQLNVAGYHINELAGNGVMFNLVFNVIGDSGTASDITWDKMVFNNGTSNVTLGSGNVKIISLNVSGKITELHSSLPITDAVVSFTGPMTYTAITDDGGLYTQALGRPGDYSATSIKIGDIRDAISPLDAVWVLQCALGMRAATLCPPENADVNLDGAVGAFDASFIARYLVGNESAMTGQWFFTPESHELLLVDVDLDDQNYVGYLKGDVTGNWSDSAAAVRSAAHSVAESVGMSLPTQEVIIGQTVVLPLAVDNVAGQDVLGYLFNLKYNQAALRFVEIQQQNTLSDGWALEYNDSTPGELAVVGYNVLPLEEEGTLLNLAFEVISIPEQRSISLALNDVKLNEGKPDAVITPGALMVGGSQLFLPMIVR